MRWLAAKARRICLDAFRAVDRARLNDQPRSLAGESVVSSSADLAVFAASLAKRNGFEVLIDNACDNWDYRDAAAYLLERARQLSVDHPTCCVISVGKVYVQLPSRIGEGGRNQHFALWCARELARRNWRSTVLSAASDGIDGNGGAAGAVCDEATISDALRLRVNVTGRLNRFDSSPLLRLLGADITTGATGNNFRDLRMIFCDLPRPLGVKIVYGRGVHGAGAGRPFFTGTSPGVATGNEPSVYLADGNVV